MGMPDTARRYTVDEVLAFPADGNRYELVQGERVPPLSTPPIGRREEGGGRKGECILAQGSCDRIRPRRVFRARSTWLASVEISGFSILPSSRRILMTHSHSAADPRAMTRCRRNCAVVWRA